MIKKIVGNIFKKYCRFRIGCIYQYLQLQSSLEFQKRFGLHFEMKKSEIADTNIYMENL